MATIKPIEGRSVHQIQSGQVIGDGLTSAVKELVENSLDAHATSIEVRFKNYGLDSLEVADNGDGITRENYESVALKHYTSKLSTYEDLENVQTFGFRGEALSSLCALSTLSIITATKEDAPKGSKLEFETSGRLNSCSVVAALKGTTVISENLFKNLPVRRKELERNIKREYTKVLGLLQAYASIKTGVKFSVFNQPPKGKKTLVFATKANPTTKENISNVFGAKTISALVTLDLEFEMQSKPRPPLSGWINRGEESKKVRISGHISKPVVGEGRLAPDRQMFFVNERPCNLPQVSRAFNEVYKQFNVTQSPFIFANLQLDTNAYDVNVSPDKRTILLHDQNELLESLKESLMELFSNHEQYVPHTQLGVPNKSALNKPPSLQQCRTESSVDPSSPLSLASDSPGKISDDDENSIQSTTKDRDVRRDGSEQPMERSLKDRESLKSIFARENSLQSTRTSKNPELAKPQSIPSSPLLTDEPTNSTQPSSYTPFDRMALYRQTQRSRFEPATITIGDTTITSTDKSPARKKQRVDRQQQPSSITSMNNGPAMYKFLGKVRNLAAPGTQVEVPTLKEVEDDSAIDNEDQDNSAASPDSQKTYEGEPTANMEVGTGPHLLKPSQHIKVEQSEDADTLFLPGSGDEQDEHDENEVPEVHQDDESEGTDGEYIDEEELRAREKRRVERLAEEAEAQSSKPSALNKARAERLLRGRPQHSIKGRTQIISTSLDSITKQAAEIKRMKSRYQYMQSMNNVRDTSTEIAETPEERLTLTISKSDFARMRIIGQFNRGFIITTRSNPPTESSKGSEDLFIIDQHASDEKYNFETLQATTIMRSQPLVRPKPLDLMAMDEEIVKDNLDTLKANGFSVEVDEDASSGQKCRLLTLPMSENTVFDLKDLEELIHLMSLDGMGGTADGSSGNKNHTLVRPSKVRKIFAMRACRSSVMVGKALTIEQMRKIVGHMGELDKPWNCPHGRPTMRHLCDLGQMESWVDDVEGAEGCQWGGQLWEDVLALYRSANEE
ncbi:hypothetical protein BDZ91DRAFT_852844 [Kalaharituber pfeilii]|nr:hypothetical protein BDZ91DRAFT_852844 [Kalaharituber pfeilii]